LTVDELRSLVEASARDIPVRELSAAFDRIAASYDAGRRTEVASRTDAVAYALGRALATYSAVECALRETALVRPGWRPRTVLDLGAGIGSASLAAIATFDSIHDVTLVERSEKMMELGTELVSHSLGDATWLSGDAAHPPDGIWDLVIASYVLSELADADAVERWFDATAGELVIVEAGTPAAFERLRAVRGRLISRGAAITAPCPHENACPMRDGDWCHFGVRVARSRLQRRVKSGERGFEDEKYAYVVASKQGPVARSPRILRRPDRRTGHVRLRLCAEQGVEDIVVSRRHADLYRQARKAVWGEAWKTSEPGASPV